MPKYYFKRILLMVLPIAGKLSAQNMNSPYSIYGIGDIDFRPYNRTSGMGGTGLAIKSSFYMIDNNPAALSGMTRSFYIIDGAATGKTVAFAGDAVTTENSNAKDFWIKRLAFGVKLNNFWGSNIGFSQYSNVNYKFYGYKPVEGSASLYTALYEGTGGLYEYFWTNGFAVGKHLSLGLRTSLISGSFTQTETVADATLSGAVRTQVVDAISKGRVQTGAIYTANLNKNWNVSIGGKYAPKINMTSSRSLEVSQNETVLLQDDFIKSDRFSLPTTYAAGIAIKHKNKTTYAVDYTYEDWSSLNIKEAGWSLISSNRLSAGVEISQLQTRWNQLAERRFFQFGGYINNSYLQIRNTPITEFGISAGMGGALGPGLLYTMALEGGRRGTTSNKLIKENFVQMTLTLSYRDFFKSKVPKYD